MSDRSGSSWAATVNTVSNSANRTIGAARKVSSDVPLSSTDTVCSAMSVSFVTRAAGAFARSQARKSLRVWARAARWLRTALLEKSMRAPCPGLVRGDTDNGSPVSWTKAEPLSTVAAERSGGAAEVVTLGTTAAAARPVAKSKDRNERFIKTPHVVGGCRAPEGNRFPRTRQVPQLGDESIGGRATTRPAHVRRYRQPRMYWFLLRPKWIGFTLGIVLSIVLMVNLGFWQLRRLDQRREFNAAVEARYDAAPQPLDSVLTPGTDPEDVQWLPVTAVGTYRPEGTIHIVNRSQNGFAGDNIVVPLDLGDGRVLLVNRGFLPFGEKVPPPPTGEVTLTGRLRPSQSRHFAQLSDRERGHSHRGATARHPQAAAAGRRPTGRHVRRCLRIEPGRLPCARAGDQARPERGPAPLLCGAVVHLLDRGRGRLGARDSAFRCHAPPGTRSGRSSCRRPKQLPDATRV